MIATLLDIDRYALARHLIDRDMLVGIELGVASGDFSAAMVRSGQFSRFYGVDLYGDHHDVAEYRQALQKVGLDAPYNLLRMSFDDALPLFPDDSLDFAYVDGYAHTGENGGSTIFSWLEKVKIGGVLAGHDYDPKWPLVIQAVDHLAQSTGFPLMVTNIPSGQGKQDKFASWAVRKTKRVSVGPIDRQRTG